MQAFDPPQSYAQWLALLDRFRDGDDSVLEAMRHGSIEWTNIVAERWTRQVTDALTGRLKALSKQLQAGLNRAGSDSFAISNALLGARRSLAPLRAFVAMPCFPDNVRAHLGHELERWVAETQHSLEKSATEIRLDKGQLLKAIRGNPLNATVECEQGGTNSKAVPATSPPRGRRVIL